MPDKPHAIIIGYGEGIGAALARAFGGEGMALSLIARTEAKVKQAAEGLSAAGHSAAGFAADAGDEASLRAAIVAATERFGDADVLIYNAATWRPGPVLETSPESLVGDFRLCTVGALVAAQAVAPAMRQRGRGSILFTGGGFALQPSPQAPSLSIGKAGLRALALMLAEELAPAGIRVGTVTVLGTVAAGTRFDPDAIAAAFVELRRGPPDRGTAEVQFS